MLRLSVEGPEEEVRGFLKDFALLPQHRILATSAPYLKKGLGTNEIQMACKRAHYCHVQDNRWKIFMLHASKR